MPSYKNYEGEIVTITLQDKEVLLCRSLLDLDIKETKQGLLILNKETKEEYGYLVGIEGIDFDAFMQFFSSK